MSQVRNNKKTIRKVQDGPDTDSALFLALLLFSAAFFGLLFASSSRILGYEVDSIDFSGSSPKVKTAFERSLEKMVAGHPMEDMAPFLARQDKVTASYLVAIAKHESNWGRYSPKMDGVECYNYWGYRGQTESVTKSGYSCFESPKQAVAVVGKRLNYLIWDLRLDTPEELLVWKCGSNCASHDQGDVNRWARNVGVYSRKVENEANF